MGLLRVGQDLLVFVTVPDKGQVLQRLWGMMR